MMDRLLTKEEAERAFAVASLNYRAIPNNRDRIIAKAQDAKTAQIVRAETEKAIAKILQFDSNRFKLTSAGTYEIDMTEYQWDLLNKGELLKAGKEVK